MLDEAAGCCPYRLKLYCLASRRPCNRVSFAMRASSPICLLLLSSLLLVNAARGLKAGRAFLTHRKTRFVSTYNVSLGPTCLSACTFSALPIVLASPRMYLLPADQACWYSSLMPSAASCSRTVSCSAIGAFNASALRFDTGAVCCRWPRQGSGVQGQAPSRLLQLLWLPQLP